MLVIIDSLKKLRFGELMEVYRQSLTENGVEFYPGCSSGEQLLRAEQDFYAYLKQGFFNREGDHYCIWEENGKYRSALRLQRFEDGWLLEALETCPEQRKKGYAAQLIQAVQHIVRGEKLYSHILPGNGASIAVHTRCGFCKIMDFARLADGSINLHCETYLYQTENTG